MKKFNLLKIFILFLIFLINPLHSVETNTETENALKKIIEMEEKDISKPIILDVKKNTSEKVKEKCKTFTFNYENEDLSNVINKLAGLKCENIILPQPPLKFTPKLTFSSKEEMPLDDAWNILQTILDTAGFSLVKKENIYQVVPNLLITRELLPIYVNSVETIPNTDEKIRFIYFFQNINIQTQGGSSFTNLDQILRDMLTNEPETSYLLDTSSNSLIISNKANNIIGVMKIIQELDKTGFREVIEIIPLVYTKSDFVTNQILNKIIAPTENDQFRFGPPIKVAKGGLFSESTKIIPLDRLNSLAILGTPESVKRVRDFVEKYIDLPIESGKSIIHVKPIENLDANELAPVIQNLVKARAASSQAEAEVKDGLANAIIVAEQQVAAQALTPSVLPGAKAPPPDTSKGAIMGGNNIIVAARSADWQIINKLIDDLDKPQLQVAIEVLVAELRITEDRLLGAQTRNFTQAAKPSNLNFQTTHLHKTWLNFVNPQASCNIDTQRGIASNLAQLAQAQCTGDSPPLAATALINIAEQATEGTTVLTFDNGNGVSQILEILNNYTNASILSQPYVVAKNHKTASITVADTKLVPGSVRQESVGGPVIQPLDWIKADITVDILPRISSLGDINLEVSVAANSFAAVGASVTTRLTRRTKTNSNVNNKEVLVIGGLMRNTNTDVQSETSPFSKIPIIGNLFKSRERIQEKAVLMIFISPTIIKPRIEGALSNYSISKLNYLKNEVKVSEEAVQGVNFEQLRDPITRMFFSPVTPGALEDIDEYAKQSIYEAKLQTNERKNQVIEKQIEEKKLETNNKEKKIKELIKNDENPLIKSKTERD